MSSRKLFSKIKKIVSRKNVGNNDKQLKPPDETETPDDDESSSVSSYSYDSSSSSSSFDKDSDDEVVEDERETALREEFLIYSNYRLLPGWCATKSDVVASFREHYSPKYDTEDLITTEEIENLLDDWYERRIRKEISDDGTTYQGFHLNPRYLHQPQQQQQQQGSAQTPPTPVVEQEVTTSYVDTIPTYLPKTNPNEDTRWNVEDLSESSSSKAKTKKKKKSKENKKKKKTKKSKSDDDNDDDDDDGKKRKSSKKDKKKKKKKSSSKKNDSEIVGEESVSTISLSMRELDMDGSINI